MKHHITLANKVLLPILTALNRLRDVANFVTRLWVAKIFLESGLSKIHDWGATMVLFMYDYSVPLMSPTVAAYLGTAAEFALPVLLILGFGGRLVILLFFVYNIICVISFHFLWTPVGSSGLNDHVNWGLLLLMLLCYNSGRFSIDHLLHKKFGHLFTHGKHFHID